MLIDTNGSVFFVLVLVAATLVHGTSSELSPSEATGLCARRAGLKLADISRYDLRNHNCTIDCTTQQATLLSYHLQDGLKCRPDDLESRCQLGLCVKPEEISALDVKDLFSVDIYIKSAHVEDLDLVPGAGPSDPLVTVELASGGAPSYADGQTVCHTYIIQDSNTPRWNGGCGFHCRPMPIKATARLRFTALDSDKPIVEPDLLGTVTERVDRLLNLGSKRLKFDGKQDTDLFLEVELKGSPYKTTE